MNGLYMSLLQGKTKEINTKGSQFLKPKAHSDTFTRKYNGFFISAMMSISTPFPVTCCVTIYTINSRTCFFYYEFPEGDAMGSVTSARANTYNLRGTPPAKNTPIQLLATSGDAGKWNSSLCGAAHLASVLSASPDVGST